MENKMCSDFLRSVWRLVILMPVQVYWKEAVKGWDTGFVWTHEHSCFHEKTERSGLSSQRSLKKCSCDRILYWLEPTVIKNQNGGELWSCNESRRGVRKWNRKRESIGLNPEAECYLSEEGSELLEIVRWDSVLHIYLSQPLSPSGTGLQCSS